MRKYPVTREANHQLVLWKLVLWKFVCFHEDPGGTHLAEIYGIPPPPPLASDPLLPLRGRLDYIYSLQQLNIC